MDEEDVYGIPRDYYVSESKPQNYTKYVYAPPFDNLLDDKIVDDSFDGLGSQKSSSGSIFQQSLFELDEIENFNDDPPGHRGLGPYPQCTPGLLSHRSPERSALSDAYYNQSSSFCERQNAGSYFQGPNTHLTPAVKQRTQLGRDVKSGLSDNCPLLNGGTGGDSSCKVDDIRLRQVSELPDVYRNMFKFGVFNAMQSSCFDTIMKSGENVVVSAPTGSGKTVLFELSIIHMLVNSSGRGDTEKCVYVAPTKALCAERIRDWTEKFGPVGIRCCELTGDTAQPSGSIWGDLKSANIIITTIEKWDSLTRSWSSHSQPLSKIQLFLIDEVHILNELRGSTLEVVVSRMKARGSAMRFVAVSATVPNIDDVARWIASRYSNGAAATFRFGEAYRPCQISRFVYGFPRGRNQNDFLFAQSLNYRLFPLLQQHSANKPILIFVSTRKGVLATAEQLMIDYHKAVDNSQTLPWSLPKKVDKKFQSKQLEKLAAAGIGAHHAGLELSDKRSVEELFMNRVLRVVVATSTLAVGVNLPAHIVVIKDVRVFQNGISQEYSDLDIMQMMGRAGRPQFDKEAVAIIMCESGLENKYRALGHGQTILESSLHTNLSEHLNSEVGLGTIKNMATAKEWLRNTFMYRRVVQNPERYMLKEQEWQEGLDGMISKCFNDLKHAELLTDVKGRPGELRSTEFGDIMSKFYIKQATMALIMNLPVKATLREMLETLAASEEFSELKMRAGDKQVYNTLREHEDIRFKIKRVEKTADKVFLLIQAVLGRIPLHTMEYKSGETNALLDSLIVFRHASRIGRALVEVAIAKRHGAQIKHGLELTRNLSAKVWEDRPSVLCQIETIGEKSMKVLAQHGITDFEKLRGQDPIQIDLLLNKKQASGHKILFAVRELPQYSITIDELSVIHSTSRNPVELELEVQCSVSLAGASSSKSKAHKNRHYHDMTYILTVTSDFEFIDFRRIPTKGLQEPKSFSVIAQLTKPSQSIYVYMSSDTIAGVTTSSQYKPRIDLDSFPVADTRPMTSMEMVLDGLEGNEDFWNVELSDDETPVGDSTQDHSDLIKEGQGAAVLSGTLRTNDRAKIERGFSRLAKLPNGKYRCNHPCKDKSTCRHLCCRDGVKKPPPAPRQRGVGPQPRMMKKKVPQVMSGDSVLGSKRSTLALAKVSAQLPVSDASLRQPKVLHKSSGTDSHLRIANGKRIKLLHDLSSDDTQPTGSTTTKKMPKFDMNFSVLKEGDVTGDTPLFYLSDSDELPEPHELLRASVCGIGGTEEGLSVRTSDYSASHTDAVIRDGGTTQSETNAAETHDASTSSHTRYIESILPLKRKGSTDLGEDCTSFTITRAEATPPPPPPPLSRCLQPQKRTLDADAELTDDNTVSGADVYVEEEGFVLEKTPFSWLNPEETRNPPAAPSLRRSFSPSEVEQLSTLGHEEPSFYVAWKNKQRENVGEHWNPLQASSGSLLIAEPEHDHLAEFQEWLATTNSIEFIG